MKSSYALALLGAIGILGINGIASAETSRASAQVLIIIPERPDLYPEDSPNQEPSPAANSLQATAASAKSFGTVVKTFQPGNNPHVVYTYTDFN